ncbi:putative reverse transcriptase zinc-binding domain-containing protein [Lupinus albus]|uniref:Putative reverse transcriptase zinc-binding domain-containing protein n=1 Tax=Lupinus albus TaxID=3870 RepID=A0A6A4QVJ4_LUPAL|nr:putative reverse transcriptase zinc-binding domain-containing protein [Lupinus albus]
MRYISDEVELFKRKVISSNEDIKCTICKNDDESIDHLFINCELAFSVWNGVYVWLQVMEPKPSSTIESSNLHYDIGRNSKGPKFWRMVWFVVMWSIWTMRNNLIFSTKEVSYIHIMELIRARTWS